jgi:hypothetical protein
MEYTTVLLYVHSFWSGNEQSFLIRVTQHTNTKSSCKQGSKFSAQSTAPKVQFYTGSEEFAFVQLFMFIYSESLALPKVERQHEISATPAQDLLSTLRCESSLTVWAGEHSPALVQSGINTTRCIY